MLAKSSNISAIAGTNWGDIAGRNGGDRAFFQSLDFQAPKTFSAALPVDKVKRVGRDWQISFRRDPERFCHGRHPISFD